MTYQQAQNLAKEMGVDVSDVPSSIAGEMILRRGLPPKPTRFVAVDRVVMQGQVFICRAPSHEKAKKIAEHFNKTKFRFGQ